MERRVACIAWLVLLGCGPGPQDEGDELPEGELSHALGGNAIRRPHWGSARHGDPTGTTYASGKFPWFSVWKWPGCHREHRFFIDSSIPSSWVPGLGRAFATWDIGTRCSPHWARTSDPSAAHVTVRRKATSACDPTNDPARVWHACAQLDAANSSTFWQRWTITFNAEHPFRVGTTGYRDAESILVVELAHAMHMGHNPNWTDSVSQANTGRWGDYVTSAGSTAGEVASTSYTVCPSDSSYSCGYRVCAPKASGGCGNLRALRTGDFAFLSHNYALNPSGCATTGKVETLCTACCGDGTGRKERVCGANHLWAERCVNGVDGGGTGQAWSDAGSAGSPDAGATDAGIAEPPPEDEPPGGQPPLEEEVPNAETVVVPDEVTSADEPAPIEDEDAEAVTGVQRGCASAGSTGSLAALALAALVLRRRAPV
ncbi:MAG: hypothetical protein HYZ28_26350 [Myxococcales bacterium]|nr:hypothetical protein [Myxococcales bacterium]